MANGWTSHLSIWDQADAPEQLGKNPPGNGESQVAKSRKLQSLYLRKFKRACRLPDMSELVFEVIQESDGGFCAECLTEAIFTQGDTWEELRAHVKEAVEVHFYKHKVKPHPIRLHLVRDEVLAGA